MSANLAEHRVQTAVFDGPIDLLLTLAQRKQVDLNQVRLADLTTEYLEAMRATEAPSAGGDGRFRWWVLKLLALKAAALLPGPGEAEEEEDLEAWEAQVKERMQEYERFKTAALELMRRHETGGFAFNAGIEGAVVPVRLRWRRPGSARSRRF